VKVTVETEVDNKHLIVASCWFFLSLHIFLTMYGHRNLKLIRYIHHIYQYIINFMYMNVNCKKEIEVFSFFLY